MTGFVVTHFIFLFFFKINSLNYVQFKKNKTSYLHFASQVNASWGLDILYVKQDKNANKDINSLQCMWHLML